MLSLLGAIACPVAGCDKQAGSISVKDAPPATIESEIGPTRSAPKALPKRP
jgi:hypothetical protein